MSQKNVRGFWLLCKEEMKTIPLDKIVRWIEPGPLLLLSTSCEGRNNVMTFGFHMMIQHYPPLIGIVVGPWDYSQKALISTKECVIAVPGVDLMEKAVDIGNCSGLVVDKFEHFHLTARVASEVRAPLIEECLANLECRVVDMQLVGQYNLFVLEAVKGWENESREERRIFHHNGNGTFSTGGEVIDLRSRMTKWKEITKD